MRLNSKLKAQISKLSLRGILSEVEGDEAIPRLPRSLSSLAMTKGFAMTQMGFTLIEIVIVLAFVSIISTIGIAGYVQYSRVQKLNAASLDFATVLQTAKSRALSQVKVGGGSCGQQASILDGYRIVISSDSTTHSLQAMCKVNQDVASTEDTTVTQTKKLPSNITFSLPGSASSATIFFNVLTGLVTVTVGITNINIDSGYAITLNSSENSSIHKTVTVYSNGRIIVQ